MKFLLTLMLLAVFAFANAQPYKKAGKPIQTVERVFKDYIKYSESSDSEDDKNAIKTAFNIL